MQPRPFTPVDEFFTSDMTFEAIYKAGPTVDETVINVIFDRAGSVQDFGEIGVQNTDPMATCRTVDVWNAEPNVSTLTIGGDAWKVIRVDPDGTGITTLYLSRVGA